MKSLLVPFFDDDAAQSALSHAIMIANRFNGHIEGVFIAPRPQVVGDAGMVMISSYATQIDKEIPQLAERAKSRFESVLAHHDVPLRSTFQNSNSVSAGWSGDTRVYDIGDYGRVFDMIIVGRGFGDQWTNWNTICESALFESGRPVLITTQKANTPGDHIAIAWNSSTETARTIALSMPILRAAKKVTVITLEGWSVLGPDGEQLVTGLQRNGIKATLVATDLNGRTPGQAIIDEAISAGADTLVKGAYTHSRLRQYVFGGATRHILQQASLPVIMAH